MSSPISSVRDDAVYTVLQSNFPAPLARAWLRQWEVISAQKASVYDAIVTFVNLIEDDVSAPPSAWLRVLLIDAVTQVQQEHLVAV